MIKIKIKKEFYIPILAIVLFIAYLALPYFVLPKESGNLGSLSNYGDYIGGAGTIFSLITIWFLIYDRADNNKHRREDDALKQKVAKIQMLHQLGASSDLENSRLNKQLINYLLYKTQRDVIGDDVGLNFLPNVFSQNKSSSQIVLKPKGASIVFVLMNSANLGISFKEFVVDNEKNSIMLTKLREAFRNGRPVCELKIDDKLIEKIKDSYSLSLSFIVYVPDTPDYEYRQNIELRKEKDLDESSRLVIFSDLESIRIRPNDSKK